MRFLIDIHLVCSPVYLRSVCERTIYYTIYNTFPFVNKKDTVDIKIDRAGSYFAFFVLGLCAVLAYVGDVAAVVLCVVCKGIHAAVVVLPCAVWLAHEHDIVFVSAVVSVYL